MKKIKVKNPVVELDGDEMTRIIWQFIKDKLILPYLDIDLKYYDLGIENRDATDDQVTVDAANAIKQYGVGVKCATITPDEARVKEFGLKKMWKSPNGTIRNILAAPSSASRSSARTCRAWSPAGRSRSSSAATPSATSTAPPISSCPARASSPSTFTPTDGGKPIELRGATTSRAAASRWPCTTLDESIRGFARACFNYGADRELAGLPLDQEHHPQGLRRPLQGHLPGDLRRRSSRREFKAAGITYEHRLIDDMVAAALKWNGGYVWACKNYDGDVQSDTVAQGFGSLGLMTSVLHDARRQDGRGRGGARHRDPPLPPAPAGQGDLDQPDRLDLRLDARPRPTAASSTARPSVDRSSPRRWRGSASRRSRPAT